MNTIYINTDGGSRGNPGPAAIGIVFFDESGKIIHSAYECIGVGTNNEAEYKAIIRALEILKLGEWQSDGSNPTKVICRLDSLLVVEQINGHWKIKQEHLLCFNETIRELRQNIALDISFIHVPREQNKAADKLVNEALDAKNKIC